MLWFFFFFDASHFFLFSSTMESRKLRSKSLKVESKALFDFDNVNEYLYNDKEIAIGGNGAVYQYYGCGIPELPKLKSNTKIVERQLPRRPPKEDPLPDTTYDIFYRRMKKNEKQMSNEERIKNLWELDTLQSQLERLTQYDWIRSLPDITVIKDMKDYDELERKKELTIKEIERLLQKHENWRKRKEVHSQEMKEWYGGSDSEYDVPIEELRERRKLEKRQRYGPVIRLNLGNDYCLVIDPLATPKIEKCEEPPKPKGKPIIKLEDVEDISQIDIQTKDNILFGTNFEDIPTYRNGFQLPLHMRRMMHKQAK